MKAKTEKIAIGDLMERHHVISYPEFQREPSVWGIRQKRLLIDSLLRGFDIGNIYIVADSSDITDWQCVDGQQRLNAIFSFVGVNFRDKHNRFVFRPENEVYEDEKFLEISECSIEDVEFEEYKKQLLSTEVRLVFLTGVEDEWELNHQFQRLQVAQILNGAEKLNAMVGEIRDRIFGEHGLGKHRYFSMLAVRRARFGGPQTATQAVLNAISYEDNGSFCRTRFLDMQILFKRNATLDVRKKEIINRIESCADWLADWVEPQLRKVKNRALGVSLLLFRYVCVKEDRYSDADWTKFGEFLDRLDEKMKQVGQQRKIIDPNSSLTKYERLQLAITQASVERPAIQSRHDILEESFDEFIARGDLSDELEARDSELE